MSTMIRVASHMAAALLLTLPLACSGHPDTCCTETVSRTTVQGECGNTGCRLRCCGGGKTVQGECCKKVCCPRCGKEYCRHCGQCPCCLDYTCVGVGQTWFDLLGTNRRNGNLIVLGGFSRLEDARTAMRAYGGDSSYRDLEVVRVRAVPAGDECDNTECCRGHGKCLRCLDSGRAKPDLKDGKCRCTACECGTTGKCTCTSGGKQLKDPCACRCGCLSTGKCVCTPDKAR